MDAIKFDERGLVPAVVQDRLTGEVRMVAYMNREAVERTLATGRATFFSRSRKALWEKGESSGHTLHVREIYADCDADTLVVMVDPVGPSCHTGQPSCFFRHLDEKGVRDETVPAAAFLMHLEREIGSRKASSAAKSYTKSLLEGGSGPIGCKLREEAAELAKAIASESDERVASEAPDVVYHLLVGLPHRRASFRTPLQPLPKRSA